MSYPEIVKELINKQTEQNTLVKAQSVKTIMQTSRRKGDESFFKNMQTSIRKYQMMYNQQAIIDEYGQEAEEMMLQLAELMEQHNNGGVSNKDIYGYFVTVNPQYDEDTDTTQLAKDLSKAAEKVSNKKGVFSAQWCIEQGASTMEEAGRHPHLHMLIQRNIDHQGGQPSKLKTGIINSFKRFGTSQLNIKIVKNGQETPRLLYIQGQKGDPDKLQMVEVDKEWRKMIGLNNIYSK